MGSTPTLDSNAWRQKLGLDAHRTSLFSVEGLSQPSVHALLAEIHVTNRAALSEEIYRLSQGDPLLVRLYLESLRASPTTRERLPQTPPGLEGWFSLWWSQLRARWIGTLEMEPLIEDIFDLLAASIDEQAQPRVRLAMLPPIKRSAFSLGLTVVLSFAFVPSGCGSVQPVVQVPDGIAGQLKACAIKHSRHVGAEDHTVTFDVKLDYNGQVDFITLIDSDVGDEELETCMASAIRSLTEEDLTLRSEQNGDRELAMPQSRMLLGFPGVPGHSTVLANPTVVAACLASPPCLLSMVVLMGATVITVQIMVHAASTTAKPTATTTAVPTATATTTTTSQPIAVPRRCLPCLPVPVGGLGYKYDSAAAGEKPHYGMANHTHHYKMHQSPPAKGCRCFWDPNFQHPTAEFSPLPGAVPVSTPGGGGIAP